MNSASAAQRAAPRLPYGVTAKSLCAVFGLVYVVEVALARELVHIPPAVLVLCGGNFRVATFGDLELWRLAVAVFLHGGLLHVAFNSYALLLIGSAVERVLSPGWMLAAFVFSGLCGSLMSAWLNPWNAVSIGASGGVFGLIAMAASLTWLAPAIAPFRRDALVQWLVFALVIGFVAGFDNWGHLGGIGGGLLVALAIAAMKARPRTLRTAGKVGGGVAIALSVLSLGLATVSFLGAERSSPTAAD